MRISKNNIKYYGEVRDRSWLAISWTSALANTSDNPEDLDPHFQRRYSKKKRESYSKNDISENFIINYNNSADKKFANDEEKVHNRGKVFSWSFLGRCELSQI